MTPIDLGPAGLALLSTVSGVEDDHLDRPTPCEDRTVGQLVQHLVGLTLAFRAAADKDFGPYTDTPPDDGGWPQVEAGWREALQQQVPALVEAWRADAAWTGMTRAGGIDLPGEIAARVALDEVVLHGWDLARATGQDYHLDDDIARACLAFVETFDAAGTPGLFGPAVPAADDAPVLDRLVARAGRDPRWAPR